MMPSSKAQLLLRGAASALLGLGALAAVLGAFLLQETQDIRPILLVDCAGFFGAAWFAPSRLAVAIFGIVPALLLSYFGLAFADHFFLAAFVLLAALAVSAAWGARWLDSSGRMAMSATAAAGAITAAILIVYRVVPALEEQRAYVAVEQPLAPFSVRTLYGETISSDAWRGKVVVLAYWSTWCPPCLAEMPKIAALQARYLSDPKVEIIALNAGYGGDTVESARNFLERRALPLSSHIDDVYTDDAKGKGMAARSLGLKVVPTLFIVNPSGKLVAVHTGYDNSEDLLSTLPRRIALLRPAD